MAPPQIKNGDPGGLLPSLLRRLLDPTRRADYLAAVALAAWPAVLAYFLGAHRTITTDGYDLLGYWTRPNWIGLIVLFPLTLFLFRWAMGKVASVLSPWPPRSCPEIIGLIETEPGRKRAYESLRRTLLSPWNIVFTLAVVAAIHVSDLWPVIEPYVQLDAGNRAQIVRDLWELDWTVMFLVPSAGISRWENLVLVGFAYLVQFLLVFILLLFVVLVLRHNLFFLARVYQRRRVPEGGEEAYIGIDLDDVNRCFGFRRANEAFNTQVLVLTLAGLGLLFSRFANVQGAQQDEIYGVISSIVGSSSVGDLSTAFRNLSPGTLFPDLTQWVMAAAWLLALFIVSLPAFVKLLPLGNPAAKRSIVSYLREFLPDDEWPYREDPGTDEIDALSAKFAQNDFWPTGNNRAKQLFFFSFWVFLVVLFPLAPRGEHLFSFLGFNVVLVGLALACTALVLKLLNLPLRFIDERLVEPAEVEPGGQPASRPARRPKFRGGIFISYRRADTMAYAGRLRDHLLNHVDQDRLFMDIDTIRAGADFVDAIHEAIRSSDVLVALVGSDWLTITDDAGERRLDNPDDYVRLEISTAWESGVPVVPVLVGGATMPSAGDLPDEFSRFSRLNAVEISDTRWQYDVERLVEKIGETADAEGAGRRE